MPMPPTASPLRMQRATGTASVAFLARDGRAALARLHQQGSAKAIVHMAAPAGARGGDSGPEVVFLNTAGGLASGDRMHHGLTLAAGLRATATTQTAERAYRAPDGPARVTLAFEVGCGAHLDWLPQETILFQGAALDRQTRIALAPGATCLALETLVLGRAAMGETLTRVALTDWREITRDGRPFHLEPVRLTGASLGGGLAGTDGNRAFASAVLAHPGAAACLAPLRRVLDEPGVTAAASALEGRLVLRAAAPDLWPLRRQILRALAVLRPGRALPRVWQA